ncbi:MAG: DNA replication/repair protein RecF [Clostridiales bacterium]|nr:DNA replication/repair protein RecF [Clostridiales bacterium]
MILRRLKLENFRNYRTCLVEWHEQVNLLQGANAQGKSNLLEAICFLSLTTSFRGAGEPELICGGEQHFYAEGDVRSEEQGEFSISAAFSRDKRRKWRLDGAERRRGELVGLLHTVIFSPEDVDLVKAGPLQRRRFLNRQISQLYPEHCRQLLRYNRILAQRNGCLRLLQQPGAVGTAAEEALSAWDQQLAETGASIIWRRRQVLSRLNPLAAEIQAELAAGEKLALRYKSFAGALEAADEGEVCALFLAELERMRLAERCRGATLVGPHRDDVLIEIAGIPGKGYASQGQQRTAALACKLAELGLARAKKGEWPLLLLDDVLSELDDCRRQALLKKIDGGAQTFIASTGPLPLLRGQVWQIAAGHIAQQ